MSKLITILVPIYNAKEYIDECIDGIVNELTEDMEIILIDDGSTDGSEESYNKYKNIKEVKIIKQENHGVSYTRNRGIAEATGEFIMFVDVDDYLKKGWSNVILDNIENKYEYIIFSRELINKQYEKEELLKGCLGIGKRELNDSYIMSPCSKLYKTDFIKKEEIKFDENVINGEDMLLNFETIIKANNIKYVSTSFYTYRKNIKSSTNRFNKKFITSEVTFHNKLHSMIEENLDNSWKEYEMTVLLNGIYVCFLNYALSKERGNIKELIRLIDENEDYKNAIGDSKNYKVKKIFFFLLRRKKYNLAVAYVKIRNYVKKCFYILHRKNVITEI